MELELDACYPYYLIHLLLTSHHTASIQAVCTDSLGPLSPTAWPFPAFKALVNGTRFSSRGRNADAQQTNMRRVTQNSRGSDDGAAFLSISDGLPALQHARFAHRPCKQRER